MGKPTGFLEIERRDRGYDKPAERLKTWQEFVQPAADGGASSQQAARCMDCGIPFCHQGCPVNNQIPDWNNLVYRDQWRRGAGEPALHQQLPGVHRPRLPRALRGLVHAEHRRQPGHHQDHRVRDRRPRLAGGLDRAAAAPARHRQARGGGGLRPGGPGLRPAAGPRRPCGDGCSRRATASAACCATASPTSRWRSTSSTAASSRWRPRA